MQPLQFAVPLGPLEAVGDVLPYIILALALVNIATRMFAHRNHVQQARDGGDEAIDRFLPHSVLNVLLVLASFAYMIIHPHGGMVLSVLVLGMFLADFFEFESRKVEARNELSIEPPKSAIGASVLVLLYAAYQSLFFVIAPVWNAIV